MKGFKDCYLEAKREREDRLDRSSWYHSRNSSTSSWLGIKVYGVGVRGFNLFVWAISIRTSPSSRSVSLTLLLSSLELSDTHSLCALNTSPPRNRCSRSVAPSRRPAVERGGKNLRSAHTRARCSTLAPKQPPPKTGFKKTYKKTTAGC